LNTTIKRASLAEFLIAVIHHTKASLSGGGSVILTTIGYYIRPRAAKPLFFVAAFLCFLYACYEVWAAERNEIVSIKQAKLEANLVSSIQRCYEGANSNLLLHIDVVNTRPVAVTVKGVNLEVVTADGHTVPFQYREKANGVWDFHVTLLGTSQRVGQPDELHDLLDQISVSPLELGTHKSGSLIFQFEDGTQFDHPLKLRLTLTDAFDHLHTSDQEVECVKGVWMDA
jgi:hypothetical protein